MTVAGSAARAAAVALDAADAAGVVIRPTSGLRDAAAVATLFADTWGKGVEPDASFLHALAHAGNTVLIAERGREVVGALAGVLGWTDGLHVHSHSAAVVPAARGGVGFALKLAQRAQALEHGVAEIRWTYDPLIRRNAHLNLAKLGATVREYHPDFYGTLGDAISGTDATDRFEVSWRLDSSHVAEAIDRALVHEPPAHVDLDAVRHGIRFELHPDFEKLRRHDPDGAGELRAASRAVFTPAFDEGLSVRFVNGGYVFV